MRLSTTFLLFLSACGAVDTAVVPQYPPPGWFTLTSTAMVPGTPATLQAELVPAGASVTFTIGGDLSSPICPAGIAPTCLDLSGPSFVSSTVTADADGVASWTIPVPASVPVDSVGVQAHLSFAGQVWLSQSLTVPVLSGASDPDLDGLTTAEEIQLGTDPMLADTDGDELGDFDELMQGTSPLNPDTDGDYLPDGWELTLGSDPLVRDTDGDGLIDGWEFFLETDPNAADTDGDGLEDGEERRTLGTDPANADSDGDDCNDGLDSEPLAPGPDSDGDTVVDACDICPEDDRFSVLTNPDDTDLDGLPDLCDPCPLHSPDDPDGDGVCGGPLRVFATVENFNAVDIGPNADQHCNDSAADAGLTGSWKAWLSYANGSAADRIAGTGSTGPWVRMDGVQVIADLANTANLTAPIAYDASGNLTLRPVWTGTDREGTAASATCGDWSDVTLVGAVGQPQSTGGSWSNDSSDPCVAEYSLYCFEFSDLDGDGCGDAVDDDPAVASIDSDQDGVADDCDVCPFAPGGDQDGDGICDAFDACPNSATGDTDGDGQCDDVDPCPEYADDDPDGDGVCGTTRIAFVTSSEHSANASAPFGIPPLIYNVFEFDRLCAAEASSVGLPGRFIAWVSQDAAPAGARLGNPEGPWEDVLGRTIAADVDELLGGLLQRPINTSRSGFLVNGPVWTATNADGTADSRDCADWSSSSVLAAGLVGHTAFSDSRWTDNTSASCGSTAHLYCVEGE